MSTFRPVRAWLAIVAGFALASCGEALIGTYQEAQFDSLADWGQADHIADSLALDWPDSTRNIRIVSDGLQEPIYQVRFDIDPAEVGAFEASLQCDGLNPDHPPINGPIQKDLDWWQPEQATDFRACDSSENSTTQSVQVVESDPAITTVYVAVILT